MTHHNIFYETPWETRNLGIPSYAIDEEYLTNVSQEDISSEFSLFRKINKNYFIFARLSKKNLHLATVLEKNGFYVVECAISPYLRLARSEVLSRFMRNESYFIPKKYKDRIFRYYSIDRDHEFPESELKAIARESFSDDRFHIDHNCPTDIADGRISSWVDDLISDPDISFYVLTLNDKIIAFTAKKKNHYILGGFQKNYIRSGLGELLYLNGCKILKEQEYKTFETQISTNNLLVLNLYARLGFKFKNTQYSFHCWSKE